MVGGGTLSIISGKLPAANEYVGIGDLFLNGGDGTVVLSGGSNAVSSLRLGGGYGPGFGYSGNYTQNGPSLLSASTEYIGWGGADGGAFTQSAGTNTVASHLYLGDAYQSIGTYSLSGNSSLLSVLGSEDIGYAYNSWGGFTQSGGTHTVSSVLTIGNSGQASYSLSGGSLSANTEYIGYSPGYSTAPSSFTQTGGTHSVSSDLYLGYLAASNGTYGLNSANGPSLLSAAYEYIGYSGSGSFIQSGGTHNVSAALFLGDNFGGSGTYTLSGGSLFAAAEAIGASGSGSFIQSGGTHSVGPGGLGLFLASGGGVGVTTCRPAPFPQFKKSSASLEAAASRSGTAPLIQCKAISSSHTARAAAERIHCLAAAYPRRMKPSATKESARSRRTAGRMRCPAR